MTDPSVPASVASSESSRPSSPWPSQSMPPTMLAASEPPGYWRRSWRSDADLGELLRNRLGDRGIDCAGEVDERLVALELLQHRLGVGLVVQPGRHLGGDVAQPRLGVGRLGRLLPGIGELLADLDRLEGQRAGLDGERQLVVVAVDDAAAHGLVDVGDLELTRRLGAQARGARHLQVEQLRRRDDEHQEDDGVAGPVPEHETTHCANRCRSSGALVRRARADRP